MKPVREDSYSFGRFILNVERHTLLRDREEIPLRPKAFDLLALLVSRSGTVVGKEEILRALWKGTHVSANVLDQTVRAVRLALCDDPSDPRFIETVPRIGYRFIGELKGRGTRSIPGLKWQLFFVPTLYALLYSISVFVEVMYQFERFRRFAFLAAPAVFLGICGTSVFALWILTRRFSRRNLLLSCAILFSAGLLVFLSLMPFLPASQVTAATFQTYTAQAAYLKAASYYLAIAFGLIFPGFWYVQSLVTGRIASRQSAYLALFLLAVIFLSFLGFSMSGVSNLVEHLRPSPHLDAFQLLVRTLLVVYFLLGANLLIWCFVVLQGVERTWPGSGARRGSGP